MWPNPPKFVVVLRAMRSRSPVSGTVQCSTADCVPTASSGPSMSLKESSLDLSIIKLKKSDLPGVGVRWPLDDREFIMC
jgi:hypothetical protein